MEAKTERLNDITAKLQQAEVMQEADRISAVAETDTEAKAAIMRRMSGRISLIRGFQRTLAELSSEGESEGVRDLAIRVRVTEAEKSQLQDAANAQGLHLGEYIRQRCGL
jgi:hypothetical protein